MASHIFQKHGIKETQTCLKVLGETKGSGKRKSSLLDKAKSCTWVGPTPAVNTGWGMEGLRTALPRRTWGYWWMKSWT